MGSRIRFVLIILVLTQHLSFAQELKHYYSTLNFIQLNNHAQSAAFGEIYTISPDGYYSAGLNYNPALLNNNKKVIGLDFFIPIRTNELNKFNVGFYYAKNNKFTLAYFADYVDYVYDYHGKFDDLSIHTKFYYQLFYHSIRGAISLKNNQFLGIGLKHIYHNIEMGPELGNDSWLLKINTIALDLGYYRKLKIQQSSRVQSSIKYGFSLLNLGPKVDSLMNSLGDKAPIPTNLSGAILGNITILGGNNVTFSMDLAYQLEKYLIPTAPEFSLQEDTTILRIGYSPDVSFFKGIAQSFYDSPNGFKGEINEYIHKLGMEFRINNNQKYFAALRFGYVRGITFYDFDEFLTVGFRAGAYGFYVDYSSIPSKSIIYSKLNVGIKLNLEGNKLTFNDDIFGD